MQLRFTRSLAILLTISALLGVGTVSSAAGSPVDEKRAQAARIQRQIEANGDRIAALGEQYNGARIEFNRTIAGIADARRRFDEAQAQVDAKRALLQRRAANLYTGASADTPLRAIDVEDVGELARRSKYGAAASGVDNRAIGDLKLAQERLDDQRKALELEQAAAKRRRDAAAATKREIEQANASQQQLLSQVKGELARLVDQERRRREAAAAAAARAATTSRSTRGAAPAAVDPASVGGGFVGPIPTSGGVGAVIAYARAQLGKPYVFATAGPNTFDCSGLTKMAWAQAGVSMAHFSGAQYNAFPHVPISALQPGDLVFKGPGGRDHVALYIGGGMQIAATHTGDYVRLQPLSSNLSGAVRPG
jgi:cell wall-associated NlpC family hydrolase